MDIRPIKTDADYAATLREIDALMDAQPGTEDGDRLDVLVTLAEAYERTHHPIPAPDPIAAVRHALEAQGLEESDLQDIIEARRERVWEILNRRRRLTLPMIRRLNARLGVPAEVLIQPYAAESERT
jgi:HTH-type transcriptional regulator/antitoxin HigA